MTRTAATLRLVLSSQHRALGTRVVEETPEGALELARLYWRQVERSAGGLVRVESGTDGVELRLLGSRRPLLRLGRPETHARAGAAWSSQRIQGGALTRDAGGFLRVGQFVAETGIEARVDLVDYSPRFPARGWRRLVFAAQSRLHAAVGRRFLAELERRSRP